jgi:hypothetical protein
MGTQITVTDGDDSVDLPFEQVMQTFGGDQPLAPFQTNDGKQVGIAITAVPWPDGKGHGPPVHGN